MPDLDPAGHEMCGSSAGLQPPLPITDRAAPSAPAEREPAAMEPQSHPQAQKVSSLGMTASRKGCSWL